MEENNTMPQQQGSDWSRMMGPMAKYGIASLPPSILWPWTQQQQQPQSPAPVPPPAPPPAAAPPTPQPTVPHFDSAPYQPNPYQSNVGQQYQGMADAQHAAMNASLMNVLGGNNYQVPPQVSSNAPQVAQSPQQLPAFLPPQ